MRLVVFDVDGTLVDSQDHIVAAMSDAFAQAGLAAPGRAEVLSIVGLSLPIAVAALLPGRDVATQAAVVEGYRGAFQSRRVTGAAPLFPGAADLVARLAGRDDLLLGVATGKSRRGLEAMLAAHGLTGAFVTAHCADDHPSKPAPGMLLACLADAGVAAGRAVMIGDTTYDLDMARNAGVTGIGVGWGYHDAQALRATGAPHLAQDFDELGRIIDGWAA